jgi:hypothetical protein
MIPGMAVIQLDGPHLIIQREPQRAAAAIVGFIQQLSGPAAEK